LGVLLGRIRRKPVVLTYCNDLAGRRRQAGLMNAYNATLRRLVVSGAAVLLLRAVQTLPLGIAGTISCSLVAGSRRVGKGISPEAEQRTEQLPHLPPRGDRFRG
jgi:hypothetical protein